MLEKALREEFDCWLENNEFDEETWDKIHASLNENGRNIIVSRVFDDDEFNQEMVRCFEYYMNKYLNME